MTMRSARVSLVLMFLATVAQAPAASGFAGESANLPSAADLARCPSRCGDVKILYPFGIGPGCFRQHFELTCDNTTQSPRLFWGNNTTEIDALYDGAALASIGFKITMTPGTNTYNMSWEPPAKGVTIPSYTSLYVVGCGVEVYWFDDETKEVIGSCMTTCKKDMLVMEKELAETGYAECDGLGCCSIGTGGVTLQGDLRAFSALVHRDGIIAQSKETPSTVKVFLSYDYSFYSNDLYSSWINESNSRGAYLNFAIMDQPNCGSARNKASYACGDNSDCYNASSGSGYLCQCSRHTSGNPYILDGCTPVVHHATYNTKPKDNCTRSCGNTSIPFPFGVEEGCFANKHFRLNCTPSNLAVLHRGYEQYHVMNISLDDGSLVVINMMNGTTYTGRGMRTIYYDPSIDIPFDEDLFDMISREENIIIRWAVANLTCEKAMRRNATYACLSDHSNCLVVTRENIRLGYRCNCSSGFAGNPYLQYGCKDIDECSMPNKCNETCQNLPGSYICVTSSKQHNLLLGIATGIGCGLGSIILAISATILAKKWKKGVQNRIRRGYFKKNQGLLLEQLLR